MSENTIQTFEYQNYGYIATIKKYIHPIKNIPALSIDIKCKYEKIMPYPILKYDNYKNEVVGQFNSFYSLTEHNSDDWIEGIKNAHLFIKEINAIINKELLKEEPEYLLE